MKNYRDLLVILFIILLLPLPLAANLSNSSTEEIEQASIKIAGNILVKGQSMNYLKTLTNRNICL